MENRGDHAIDEIGGSGESITPVGVRHVGLGKQGKTGFHYMPMFAFGDAIELWCMGWSGKV